MNRRSFLRQAVAASAAGVALPAASIGSVRRVAAAPTRSGGRVRDLAEPGVSPYGPLRDTPDENGLLLPEGFTSRVIAVSGESVGGTQHMWHIYPDGAATFDDGDGGWYYVCNSEVFSYAAVDGGGVSAIHFAADGSILDAYPILAGSNSNCAGGPTPWGTWLSGEENSTSGRIWECDPKGVDDAVAREAMGRWAHEAAAVDPVRRCVYLTEDHPDGLLYRFTPTSYPNLRDGTIDACAVARDGSVTWIPIDDPSAATMPTNQQAPGARRFPGNEGCWYFDDWLYFTAKYDNTVHGIDLANNTYTLIWKGDPEALGVEGAVLSGVDNITVDEGTGDLIVAEDGGNMELVIITPDGAVAPFMRVVGAGHEASEITGPVFNPARDRLYFSSQRGPARREITEILPGYLLVDEEGRAGTAAGVTFEISGPFRGAVVDDQPAPSTTVPPPFDTLSTVTTTPAATGSGDASGGDDPGGDDSGGDDSESGGVSPGVVIGVGAAVAFAAVGGTVARRSRRVGRGSPPADA